MPSLIFTLPALAGLALAAEPLAPRPNGPMPTSPALHLIDNATVHPAPGVAPSVMDILISDGRIVELAPEINPGAARVWKADGQHVYAGFIDAYAPVSAPAPDKSAPGNHWSSLVTPHRDALAGAGLSAADAKSLRELGFTAAAIAPDAGIFRGWGAVVSTAEPYADPALGKPPVHRARTAQYLALETTGWGDGGYPDSKMGSAALIRQTYLDAAWRNAQNAKAGTNCLDALDPTALTIYDSTWEIEALLGDSIAREMGVERLAILGSGSEYKRLDALAQAARPLIIPLNFPETPDVWSVGAAEAVSLEDLSAWELAPSNARFLADRGLQVSLTSSKLPRDQKFHDNLTKAIKNGLTADQALAMLTTNPAELLGVSDTLGTIAEGKAANLVITSAPLFQNPDQKAAAKPEDKPKADGATSDEAEPAHPRRGGRSGRGGGSGGDDAQILAVWVDGRHHKITDHKDTRFDGTWTIAVLGTAHTMSMRVSGTEVTSIEEGEESKARKVDIKQDKISFVIDDTDDQGTGSYLVTGTLGPDGVIRGSGIAPDQSTFQWTGTPAQPEEKPEAKPEAADKPLPSDDFPAGDQPAADAPIEDTEPADDKPAKQPKAPPAAPVGAPFAAYTLPEIPEAKATLLVNATVWTQSDKGIIENGWVLIQDGKVAQVGQGGYPRIAAEVIDCQGKHITPGLIDAHSHTGLFRLGVNESGQAVTAEVRIADSLDPGHINFYRQLAGGLTAANLLHGSANPIGGQSQTVKLRWGALRPSDMFFEDAKPGIKFALGENVKQSNWGDENTTRYPQTRLGVETLIRDRFTKAQEYATQQSRYAERLRIQKHGGPVGSPNTAAINEYNAIMRTQLPPRDLELEILAQILAGERLVHSHSYRQDEILMLCRVAEDFGFKIGTFQHGLETYKVAEVVREHAIGASLFSDWWAYKVEVQDAIPYAGPINFEAGLLTSYNSDSDDLARRMNVEAGKALRYARASGIDMSPQDALAFVTTNPAIQLGIEHRVGTIEPGKDADIAVWSGDPLSSLTRCERTFVDGIQLFSIEQDAAHRQRMQTERARLINEIMTEGRPEPKSDPKPKKDDAPSEGSEPPTRRSLLAAAYERAMNEHIDHGPRPGDCGCNLLPRELLRLND